MLCTFKVHLLVSFAHEWELNIYIIFRLSHDYIAILFYQKKKEMHFYEFDWYTIYWKFQQNNSITHPTDRMKEKI